MRDLDYLELEWPHKHLYQQLERKEILGEIKQQLGSLLHLLEVVWVKVEIISVDLIDKSEKKMKKEEVDGLNF